VNVWELFNWFIFTIFLFLYFIDNTNLTPQPPNPLFSHSSSLKFGGKIRTVLWTLPWPACYLTFWHLNHPLLVLLIATSARCPKALIHFSRWIWDWKNVQGSIYPLFTIGDFLSWIDPEIIRAWIKTPKFLWFTLKMYASKYRIPFENDVLNENVYDFKHNAHIKGPPRQKKRFQRLQNRYQNLLDSFLESKGWAKGKQKKSSHCVHPRKRFLFVTHLYSPWLLDHVFTIF